MGLLISYPEAKLWHPCKREDVPAALAYYLAAWGREGVTAEYVTAWDGHEVKTSEPVEVK